MQKMEKTLGPKHSRTLAAANHLAFIYQKQERFALSKEFHERAVQGLVDVLGHNDPMTLTAWWCYMSMPPEWRQIDEPRAFDADHPVSITALGDQASRLYDQGRYSEAETQARMAAAQYERFKGPTSAAYICALNRLALILKNLYKFDEAEGLCRLALSVAQETLQKDDNSYLLIWNTLVMILSEQGRTKEAKE